MSNFFSIKIYKQYLNFASAHFLIFENNTREPLHGHNYRVMLQGTAPIQKSDMVFDFLDIKPIVRKICDSLDHKILIPKNNQNLKIYEDDRCFDNLLIKTPDGACFSLPKVDVLLLPIHNTSVERLAEYLSNEIKEAVFNQYGFIFSKLEVEVEETAGQSASFIWEA
ncbi:MAG: 6-carboxytetrahydropterin synthase [Bacteriovoracaceae bacterium]